MLIHVLLRDDIEPEIKSFPFMYYISEIHKKRKLSSSLLT
jgi:hypothetical protein